MPKREAAKKTSRIFISIKGKTPAYRVNTYEIELLEKIKDFERIDSRSEAIRLIIREAAKTRGLHGVQ